jgi:hypothetical protein
MVGSIRYSVGGGQHPSTELGMTPAVSPFDPSASSGLTVTQLHQASQPSPWLAPSEACPQPRASLSRAKPREASLSRAKSRGGVEE